jgi:uncharacterized protein
VYDSGAIAAAYGSVSAVTFVTAVAYLEANQLQLKGHMVAIMALMESPAIIAALILMSLYRSGDDEGVKKRVAIKHSLTNGSVMLILGSLVIGYIASAEQAQVLSHLPTICSKASLQSFS